MNDDYILYDIEEKEREIERKKDRKNKGSKKNKRFSPTPLHSLIDNMYLSLPDIKQITKIKYKNPVISLYLNFTPDMLLGDNKVMLYFDSLKHMERQKRKEYINSLTHDQKNSLKNDLIQIKEFLEHYFDYQDARSFIIFKSGNELNLVLKIPSHTRNVLTIDPDPFIEPIEQILENNKKVLYIIFERKKARLYFYHLGHSQLIDSIKSFVPSNIDLRPTTIQSHRLNHLFIHFRKTADLISFYDRQLKSDFIILFGEKNLVNELENYLSKKIKNKIKGRYFLSAHWNKEIILKSIEKTLDRIRQEEDENALMNLGLYESRGMLKKGLGEVIGAQNKFIIRRLFIDENMEAEGYVCPNHHYLSLYPDTCPVCGLKLIQVDDITDELTEFGNFYSENLRIIKDPELLKAYEGIAAITYKV